jgi:uridine kinase
MPVAVSPRLIAITGGSGSGKSTLADTLARRLGPDTCLVLTEDAYYLPRARQTPPTTGWSNEEVERVINFDNPASKDMALLRRHIEDLKAGRGVDLPVYDFATHERTQGVTVRLEPRPVIVVEGVHVLSDPAFGDLFDLTVYVDTREDLRLVRRIRRDWRERGRDPDRVIDQYLRFVRASHARFTEPAKYACDLVLADEGVVAARGEPPDREALERLAAPVWVRLRSLGVILPSD